MPKEWSWISGHLVTLQKYIDKYPPDANVSLPLRELSMEFQDTEIYLMDFWPVYPPVLVMFGPDLANQVTSKHNLPKFSQMHKSLLPITGGPNLVSMNGNEWKTWRNLFNPGFSASSLTENMPQLVDSVQLFCEKLRENAGKGVFKLDELTTNLTTDIIIKVTLDADLDCQRSENALASALRHIIRWHSFWDPRILMNPLRPLVQKYYGRVMNTYIRAELEKRFQELQSSNEKNTVRAKSVIALALEAYTAEHSSKDPGAHAKLDEAFIRYATSQIRLFLFAGNDTTSSSIVYVYHLLSQHPDVLAKVRAEHDEIFGPNPAQAAETLKNDSALLNQCRYTMAVIKETLRLYPPAATMRSNHPGTTITDRQGNTYHLDHVGASIQHSAVHFNPRVWPHPYKFLPDRFLVEASHELHPHPAAYRPFEQGPRACIGQNLVYNEMRTVLILTARTFDIKPAYQEWDALQTQNEGSLKKLMRQCGMVKEPLRTANGDRAYQTDKAGTHPADGYPCRVELLHR
jgi:cytochrome P450